MSKELPTEKKPLSVDWLVRGSLIKIGDTFDRFLGRNWTPSSSLATSELIERINRLLDAEARDVAGKGKVVPHHLQLRVEWNKFSTDKEDALRTLENELLAATVDHINDSLYYTYAPVEIEIKPDYFIKGVKLAASFDAFEQDAVELNVTVPAMNLSGAVAELEDPAKSTFELIARFAVNGRDITTEIKLSAGQSISIGRIGSNEIILDDNSVSKTHASLSISEKGELAIADTGSTNGTFINDVRIAYGKAMAIEAEDVVKFGDVDVSFEVVRQQIGVMTEKMDATPNADTVEIGEFSFTSRSGTEQIETPEEDETKG